MGGGLSTDSDITTLKRCGDEHFRKHQYLDAIFFYSSALSKLVASPDHQLGGLGVDGGRMFYTVDDYDVVKGVERSLVTALYSNRSAAYFYSGNYQNSAEDATRATEADPQYTKGYYRAAKALIHIAGREAEAAECSEKGLAVATEEEKALLLQLTELKTQALKGQINRGDGCTYSWGSGTYGQLGHGDDSDRLHPLLLETMRGRHVIDVSCGAFHSIAVLGTGELVAWGDNSRGQLGIVAAGGGLEYALFPSIVPGLMGQRVSAVSCGETHTICVTDTGRAYSFGTGLAGQLGIGIYGTVQKPSLVEYFSSRNKPIAAVACGISHTIFLAADGSMFSCGLDSRGQLGICGNGGAMTAIPYLVHIEQHAKVLHVACGSEHSLAVDNAGFVYSCGANTWGQLGFRKEEDCNQFKQIDFFVQYELRPIEVAFVACGDEFSACITRDREVYVWGLGNAGQIGNGLQENTSIPYHVEELEDKNVETLSCCGSRVVAICADGAVYSWGLAMNVFSNFEIGKSQMNLEPVLVNGFFRHMKVRQISCGRSHSIATAVGVFGPNCHVVMPTTDSFAFSAGNTIRFVVQSCDVNGSPCRTGGSIFKGLLIRRSQNGGKEEPFPARNITIDDDGDGKYSTMFKVERSGVYALEVTVHGLHIHQSPFEVFINPLEASFDKSYVEWSRLQGEDSLTCAIDDVLNFRIHLIDALMNEIQTQEIECGMTLEMADGENKTTFYGTLDNSGYSCIVTPQKIGSYVLHVWVHDTRLIAYSAINDSCALAVLDYTPISTESCEFHVPSIVTAGEQFITSIDIKGGQLHRLQKNSKLRASFKPLSHSLSPRALVRHSSFFDPLCELKFDLTKDTTNSSELWSTVSSLTIAGDYIVKIFLNSQELYAASMCVQHSQSSQEYTEVLNTHDFFSNWCKNEPKFFCVQTRDIFGNIVLRNTTDVIVAFFTLVRDDTPIESIDVQYDENGKYSCLAKLSADISDTAFRLHITLNGTDIMYSPFVIETGSMLLSHVSYDSSIEDDLNCPVKAVAFTSDVSVTKPIEFILAEISKTETTRLRAIDVLKKERRRQEAEKELKRIKAAVKRTGGGFMIQYSKEML